MTPVLEKHLRQKVLDKDGNVAKNRFGHEYTDRLTPNEIEYVEQQLASGRPIKPLAVEMETTETRIRQIRDNKDSHDRMMEYQTRILIPQHIDAVISLLIKQSEQIDELIDIQNKLVVDSKKMNKALYLKQIGEAKHRKEIRNLKAEREELRKLLHKNTGMDIGPYKRDVN